MLFTSLLPFALVATTSAGVLRRNDLATNDITGVLQVLDRINAGMSRIGSDVKLWSGDRPGAEGILEDGRQIISDLGVGARYIEHALNVGTVESLQLLGPMGTLNTLTDTFSTELIKKKPMVDRLQMAPQALTLLEHARHGALDLSREVTLKLPITTSWTASPLTNTIVDKLDKAIKTFGGGQGGKAEPKPYNAAQPFTPSPYQAQPQPWAGQGQGQPQPPPQPNYPQQQGQDQEDPNARAKAAGGPQWNSNARASPYAGEAAVAFSAPSA
jgi:Hydrophobic surface binding protein A